MTDVFMNLVGREWIETTKENAMKDDEGNPFSLNVLLKQRLDRLTKLVADKWDGMFIIDGRERSGKSNLAFSCAWYLTRGKMTINNISSGLNDCARKIEALPDRSVLVLDEGSTMFSSKDSTGRQQKQLIKIMDVVGQKNMIFIICLPCFFDLNKTIAVRRSLFLLHVRAKELVDSWKREPFYYYDEKAKGILYREGKKKFDSYRYPQPSFDGKYYVFKPPFWREYEEVTKKASLKEVLADATKEIGGRDKLVDRFYKLVHYMRHELGYTCEKIANLCESDFSMIARLLRTHKENNMVNEATVRLVVV